MGGSLRGLVRRFSASSTRGGGHTARLPGRAGGSETASGSRRPWFGASRGTVVAVSDDMSVRAMSQHVGAETVLCQQDPRAGPERNDIQKG